MIYLRPILEGEIFINPDLDTQVSYLRVCKYCRVCPALKKSTAF